MSLVTRLSTRYRGYRIFFEPELLPDARFRARSSVIDLGDAQAREWPIDLAGDVFESALAAGQCGLSEAMIWIEARQNVVVARESFVAIGWIAPEDFAALRALSTDVGFPGADYDAWLRATLTAERDVREDGCVPVRIPMRPAHFAWWCEQAGVQPDITARRRYAEDVLEGRPI
jgi:hypothetical protein